MNIKFKENVDIEKVNADLQKRGVENRFITEKNTLEWLNDINANPESPQAHLKPKGRNLTVKELREWIPEWTDTGRF